jgi:transcriptional regulator with XRE-family HTH domain
VAAKVKAKGTLPAKEERAVPAEMNPPLQPGTETAPADPPADRPNRIRELREAKGLSLRELGRRMGLTGPEIYKLENGHRRLTAAHLDRLTVILGEDAATIAGWGPAPKSEETRLDRLEAQMDRLEGKVDELLALMTEQARRSA